MCWSITSADHTVSPNRRFVQTLALRTGGGDAADFSHPGGKRTAHLDVFGTDFASGEPARLAP
jgi:hypothetical protein